MVAVQRVDRFLQLKRSRVIFFSSDAHANRRCRVIALDEFKL